MVYILYHLHKWLWVVFQDNIGRYLLVSILRVHEESDMGVKGGIDLRENAETTGTLGANNKADKEVRLIYQTNHKLQCRSFILLLYHTYMNTDIKITLTSYPKYMKCLTK